MDCASPSLRRRSIMAGPREDVACETANFDHLMTSMSKPLAPYVVCGYPWGRHSRIADFGGASGEVLKAVLQRYSRSSINAAFVVDLPQVRE